jgi:hypothetical protein
MELVYKFINGIGSELLKTVDLDNFKKIDFGGPI